MYWLDNAGGPHRHRIADEQQELVGQDLGVTSPQGRFSTKAAAVDGQRLTSVEAKGKHLFYGFSSVGHVHVHLGMRGKYLRSEVGRPPLPQARVRLESLSRRVVWELVAPSTCELIDSDQRASLLGRPGPDPLRDDADGADALRRLAVDRRSIGTVLLDLSVISGWQRLPGRGALRLRRSSSTPGCVAGRCRAGVPMGDARRPDVPGGQGRAHPLRPGGAKGRSKPAPRSARTVRVQTGEVLPVRDPGRYRDDRRPH